MKPLCKTSENSNGQGKADRHSLPGAAFGPRTLELGHSTPTFPLAGPPPPGREAGAATGFLGELVQVLPLRA